MSILAASVTTQVVLYGQKQIDAKRKSGVHFKSNAAFRE